MQSNRSDLPRFILAVWICLACAGLATTVSGLSQERSVAALQIEAFNKGGLEAAAAVTGDYRHVVNPPDWGGARSVEELVRASSVIVIGTIVAGRPRLVSQGTLIQTVYDVSVSDVLMDRTETHVPGGVLQVAILGGRVQFRDGITATVQVLSIDEPLRGSRYLCFLRLPPRPEASGGSGQELAPTFGPQGVYLMPAGSGEMVVPLDRRALPLAEAIRAMGRSDVLRVVRAAIGGTH